MVVFDVAGREVALLTNGYAVSIEGVVRWDGVKLTGVTPVGWANIYCSQRWSTGNQVKFGKLWKGLLW